jgi:hypothetical protein
VEEKAKCDSAAPTTDRIAPGTSSSCNALHAIIRSSRYIADLAMGEHHYYRLQSDCEIDMPPSHRGLRFRLSASHSFFLQTAFIMVLCERALVWLAHRLPDIGSVGRTRPRDSMDSRDFRCNSASASSDTVGDMAIFPWRRFTQYDIA